MSIVAAADGSSLRNPGPSGWAWYVDDEHWDAGGFATGTNNIGELTAVAELLAATAHLDEDLLILCDSRYVIDSLTSWLPGWKRRGWRKADGKPVKNAELMKRLDELMAGRRLRFEWVRGHAGHPLNERVDDLARAQARAWDLGQPIPGGPGWAGKRGADTGAETDDSEAPDALF
ncbi:ribonuclease HI [Nanchangia anserum]|uniref:Ribonuclease H n=1 Tax=Nanchangia anserum TaxID=2692125 RepID=A0A8I0G8C2_9ACTO|nr:RNase H family protein [Nanchangia anserum]MBD3689009.1 ribonuclease HI [Nanchangia anserum]QOX81255.1 ribonuclease HI [Nanchangia anserum]